MDTLSGTGAGDRGDVLVFDPDTQNTYWSAVGSGHSRVGMSLTGHDGHGKGCGYGAGYSYCCGGRTMDNDGHGRYGIPQTIYKDNTGITIIV